MLVGMLPDLLLAFRWLRKEPLFTTVAVLILAVGIGTNTAVFSIVDAALLRPPPFAFVDRLVRVEEGNRNGVLGGVPVKDYERWSGSGQVFEKTAPYLRDTVTLTGDGEPEQVIAVRSRGLFPLLGVPARFGRTLNPSDDDGSRNVAVLSDRLWRRRYSADPGMIGRGIVVSDEQYTVIGVMPADFEFRFPEAELWTPLRMTATSPWVRVAARLRAGVSVTQAERAMDVVAHHMEREAPKDRSGLKILVTQWTDVPDQKYRLTLVLALAAVGVVMLIACADVSGLMLSRAVQRQKEIAIRASLGAGFWGAARPLVSESFLLAGLGSLLGTLIAQMLLRLLTEQLAALPIAIPNLARVTLNSRILVFDIALCVLLAGLCSVAPMLLAARIDIQSSLRSGHAASTSKSSSRLFSSLISLEAGLAFLLLVSSGLMVRSLTRLERDDHGFQPEHVLTVRVPVGTLTQPGSTGKYNTLPRRVAYYRQILDRVRALPGIKAAAVVNNLPLSGINTSLDFSFKSVDHEAEVTSARTISGGYFAAMGIRLLAGRDFADGDRAGAPSVAIINKYLAQHYFPNRNPLGRKLNDGGSGDPSPTIVGVVKDSPQMSYELPVKGEVYIPYQQYMFATFMSTVVVRTEGDPIALASTLKKQVWAVDPNQPVVNVETMEQVIAKSIWRPRFSAWIFSVLSGLSVFLTAIGVYGVVAYTSSLRTREVGIRVALGATPEEVLAAILKEAMLPLLFGLSLSMAIALLLSRVLANLLYGISSSDPITYLCAGAFLLAIGAAASARPAWRAATEDPLPALRAE